MDNTLLDQAITQAKTLAEFLPEQAKALSKLSDFDMPYYEASNIQDRAEETAYVMGLDVDVLHIVEFLWDPDVVNALLT